jgi:hypothetical protein
VLRRGGGEVSESESESDGVYAHGPPGISILQGLRDGSSLGSGVLSR